MPSTSHGGQYLVCEEVSEKAHLGFGPINSGLYFDVFTELWCDEVSYRHLIFFMKGLLVPLLNWRFSGSVSWSYAALREVRKNVAFVFDLFSIVLMCICSPRNLAK